MRTLLGKKPCPVQRGLLYTEVENKHKFAVQRDNSVESVAVRSRLLNR